MALTYVVRNETRFGIETGTALPITYEVNILRGYEDGTIPSWFVDGNPPAPGRLRLDGQDPASVNWYQSDDLHRSLTGSSATLNIIENSEGEYDDFTIGDEFEFMVRIVKISGTNRDYWQGYVTPATGDRSITSYPRNFTVTASDRLATLAQSTVPPPTSMESITPFETILELLYRTGNLLPVVVDSGIRNED